MPAQFIDAAIVLAIVVLSALPLAAVAALAYWVYADASARGSDRPGQWALAAVLFWPVIALYAMRRHEIGERTGPVIQPKRRRLAAAIAIAVLPAYLVGVVVAPPDPFTQLIAIAGTLVLAAPLSYLFVYRDVLDRREPAV